LYYNQNSSGCANQAEFSFFTPMTARAIGRNHKSYPQFHQLYPQGIPEYRHSGRHTQVIETIQPTAGGITAVIDYISIAFRRVTYITVLSNFWHRSVPGVSGQSCPKKYHQYIGTCRLHICNGSQFTLFIFNTCPLVFTHIVKLSPTFLIRRYRPNFSKRGLCKELFRFRKSMTVVNFLLLQEDFPDFFQLFFWNFTGKQVIISLFV